MTITAERFKAATGRDPQNDDLQRCNCYLVGKPGHWQCGWNLTKEQPAFLVAPEPGDHIFSGLNLEERL